MLFLTPAPLSWDTFTIYTSLAFSPDEVRHFFQSQASWYIWLVGIVFLEFSVYTSSLVSKEVIKWANLYFSTARTYQDYIYRVRTGHRKPRKSWNLRNSFSRPGKSWNLIVGPWKSRKNRRKTWPLTEAQPNANYGRRQTFNYSANFRNNIGLKCV